MPDMSYFRGERGWMEWMLEDTVSRENSWNKAPTEYTALGRCSAYLNLVTVIYEIEGLTMSTI